MMREISYLALGGTLFMPATHKNLLSVVIEGRYEGLRSVVVDTEDALRSDALEGGCRRIEELLQLYTQKSFLLFLRPRNPEVLARFLEMPGVEKVDGFVLPKFSLSNAREYFSLLEKTQHHFMPSIEGEELFNPQKLIALKELLLAYKERIVAVRFGLEDMSRLLGIRKSCQESIFDFAAPNAALGNFIGIFKSAGFGVSGGVYGCYEDDEGFVQDLKRDLKEGLFSKTIIHPKQIALTNELYKVTKCELKEALSVLNAKEVLFGLDGKMGEKSTMSAHALFIRKRSEIYGVLEQESSCLKQNLL